MIRHKHSLVEEFPHYRDKISRLKQENPEFAKLAAEYHEIDHQLHGLQMREIPIDDGFYGSLKRKRVHIKDQIYSALTD
ncbi:DUF465 domain-containing protein [Zooshikella marina]|uniref:DUF465 domain-containing protein n=1 Tax=Zooshikella ganghwensis TaxID=202772 RepID=A0A4P9VMV8_9GAMM|nr:DUF465 domain-containing protein [Zooshikella ganghwensis]MBU2707589.1 DUF465 domain-containing protein [Zooshikella ganghwensis]RDH44758.1 DUF465 domain-containing protein [Zooshikella ganghwensis]